MLSDPLPSGQVRRFRKWRQMSAPFFNLIVAILLFVIFLKMWLGEPKPEGFSDTWPDAIRCKLGYVGTAPQFQSEFIFYFNGIRVQQSSAGPIAAYFLAGGSNSAQKLTDPEARSGNNGVIGYAPAEVWFTNDAEKRLLRPEDLKGLQMTSYDEVYVDLGFIVRSDNKSQKLDCGGDNIADIIKNHHAYTFARQE